MGSFFYRQRNKRQWSAIVVCLIATLLGVQSICLAASDPTVFEVFDSKSRKTIACKKVRGIWEPGDRLKKGRPFKAYKEVIEDLKKLLKSPDTTQNKKKRINKNIVALSANLAAQKRLCKQEATNLPHATPTPGPGGTATPSTTPIGTPTPTRSACSQPCFNQSRQTACFGIPASISGRESVGQQLWATCSGCHVESTRRNRSFSSIANAFATVPQMLPFSSSFDNQDMADLAAYLNRFNPKQCRTDWP